MDFDSVSVRICWVGSDRVDHSSKNVDHSTSVARPITVDTQVTRHNHSCILADDSAFLDGESHGINVYSNLLKRTRQCLVLGLNPRNKNWLIKGPQINVCTGAIVSALARILYCRFSGNL